MSDDSHEGPEFTPLPMWVDGFDMDLVSLMPDIVQEEAVKMASRLWLWIHASTGMKDGCEVLSHASCWNGVGPTGTGGFAFSKPQPDNLERKFVQVDSTYYTTNERCVCVSAWDLVRDVWAHNIGLMLDWKPWTFRGDRSEFNPMMYHVRGWSKCEDYSQKLQKVRRWALRSCLRAIHLAAGGEG